MNFIYLIVNETTGEVELDEAYTDESLAFIEIGKKKDDYKYYIQEVALISLQTTNMRTANA